MHLGLILDEILTLRKFMELKPSAIWSQENMIKQL